MQIFNENCAIIKVNNAYLINEKNCLDAIKRQLLILNNLNIYDVFLIIDKNSNSLKKLLARKNIIFIEDHQINQLEEYIKYYQKVIICDLEIPIFTKKMIRELLDDSHEISEYSENKLICFNSKSFILSFKSHKKSYKLKSPLESQIRFDEIDDIFKQYPIEKTNISIKLTFNKETTYFGPGPALLLKLIYMSHSVKIATNLMGLSYTKGWQIIEKIENQLSYHIVDRKNGGKDGGNTNLSEKGLDLLLEYLNTRSKINLEL